MCDSKYKYILENQFFFFFKTLNTFKNNVLLIIKVISNIEFSFYEQRVFLARYYRNISHFINKMFVSSEK